MNWLSNPWAALITMVVLAELIPPPSRSASFEAIRDVEFGSIKSMESLRFGRARSQQRCISNYGPIQEVLSSGCGVNFSCTTSSNSVYPRKDNGGLLKEPKSHLSKTERSVLRSVCLGMSNKEIASARGVAACTVKRHLENIFSKLQLRNRVEAAIYGLMIAGFRSEPSLRRQVRQWRKRVIVARRDAIGEPRVPYHPAQKERRSI